MAGRNLTRATLFAAIALWSAVAQAGTLFTVQGVLGGPATVSGTIEIDTVTGALDNLDLYVSPINYAYLPFETFHAVRGSDGMQQNYGMTFFGAGYNDGLTRAGLTLVVDTPTLIGFTGGSFRPTTDMRIWWSGFQATSELDHYETIFWPLHSGSITPLIVPEPPTLISMLLVGIILLFVVGPFDIQRRMMR